MGIPDTRKKARCRRVTWLCFPVRGSPEKPQKSRLPASLPEIVMINSLSYRQCTITPRSAPSQCKFDIPRIVFDQRQHFECSSVVGAIMDKIPTPDLVARRCPFQPAGGSTSATYSFFRRRHLQSHQSAQPLHLLFAYGPALSSQQRHDPSIAVSRMLPA
jgi:hypothetical protein